MSKWSYSLTVEEEALVFKAGYERQLPMLAQPERNRNYSEGDVWEGWQHMVCAGSELAAARMLGMDDFEPHVNTFKTRLDIPGYEIRYSFTKTYPGVPKWGLRFNAEVDDPNEIYILIVGGLEEKTRRTREGEWKGPAYRAIGWMYGRDCVDIKYHQPYGRTNYSVPPAGLQLMEDLPVRELANG